MTPYKKIPFSSQYERLKRCVGERIMILDGAMGTEVLRRNLPESSYRCRIDGKELSYDPTHPGSKLVKISETLSVTRPQIISEEHKS